MQPSDGERVRVRGRARPAELVGVALALAERDALDERDRRRLDREIGGDATPADGLAIVRHWLANAPGPSTRARIERVGSALSMARWILFAVGLALGWSAAAALLRIEVHEGRVNIVLFVGLLVLLPGLLLLMAVAAAAWANRGSSAGGGGGWRALTLGRGVRALLPQSVRDDVEVLVGRLSAQDRRYARARRALLFAWSQTMGLAFAGGALLATLGHVVFTDLAFGWSTTLDVEAARVHALVAGFAAPWAGLWPEAAPTLDLVETTRYFRVAPDVPHVHFIDPIAYGAWWPFLVMSLVAYAIVPRALAAGFAERRLGTECASAIAETPGVDRLIERLLAPPVDTRALEEEGETGHAAAGRLDCVDSSAWIAAAEDDSFAIAWAESVDDAGWARLAGSEAPFRLRDAGGRRSLAEDAERIAEIAGAAGRVAICVRAYEPPMLEFLDFLTDLRAAVGGDRALAVFLIGGGPGDHDAWRRKLSTLGDPGLVCAEVRSAVEGAG
ncbi:MAG: DUF2868 domain-containing protein [bacterium]|nr:DUF2868 domain-containing protein [bacterium]